MLKVLVVDDHVDFRYSVCVMLQALGCQCIEAHDGAAALASLARDRVDLVLLDVFMPGLDGFAVLEELARTRTPRPCVIACSGVKVLNGQDVLVKAAIMGADGVLTKPFGREQLSQAMRQCMGREWTRSPVRGAVH